MNALPHGGNMTLLLHMNVPTKFSFRHSAYIFRSKDNINGLYPKFSPFANVRDFIFFVLSPNGRSTYPSVLLQLMHFTQLIGYVFVLFSETRKSKSEIVPGQ